MSGRGRLESRGWPLVVERDILTARTAFPPTRCGSTPLCIDVSASAVCTPVTNPSRRCRSLCRSASLRSPTLRPHRKRVRPMRHVSELAAEAVTAASRFCSCVHWSAPRKNNTAHAVSSMYVSALCTSCKCVWPV